MFPDEVRSSKLGGRSSKVDGRRYTVEARSSKFKSRGSKFESRNSKLDVRSSKLETRSSEFEGISSKVEVRTPKFETRNAAFQKSTEIWRCLGSCRANSGQDGAKTSRKRPKIMPRSAPNAHEGGPHAKITAWFEKCSPNCSNIR